MQSSITLRFMSLAGFALWKKPKANFLTCEHDANLLLPFSAWLIAITYIPK